MSLALFLLSSCADVADNGASPDLSSLLTTSDNKQLSLQHWNYQSQPKRIIIALHGMQGASRDYRKMGKALSKQAPDTTLFALNLRGAGYDPSQENRGDIRSSEIWKRDLLELHQSLHKRYPEALVFWLGESMGSQIALHTAADSSIKPDGLILVSPVVSLDSMPDWQVNSLQAAAFVAPKRRVSLEAIAGAKLEETANADHFEISEKNPYHVENYTLRYLETLKELTETMNEKASSVKVPTLILYGGKDFLIEDSDIVRFSKAFPKTPEVNLFESSDHLLFHDKQKKKVVSKILSWVSEFE